MLISQAGGEPELNERFNLEYGVPGKFHCVGFAPKLRALHGAGYLLAIRGPSNFSVRSPGIALESWLHMCLEDIHSFFDILPTVYTIYTHFVRV